MFKGPKEVYLGASETFAIFSKNLSLGGGVNAPVNCTIVLLPTLPLKKYAPQKGVKVLKIKLLPEWGLIMSIPSFIYFICSKVMGEVRDFMDTTYI